MPIDCIGIQRSCKKEDVFKLKVYHLETTAKVCEEYSKTVSYYGWKQLHVYDFYILSSERKTYWHNNFSNWSRTSQLSETLLLAGDQLVQRGTHARQLIQLITHCFSVGFGDVWSQLSREKQKDNCRESSQSFSSCFQSHQTFPQVWDKRQNWCAWQWVARYVI